MVKKLFNKTDESGGALVKKINIIDEATDNGVGNTTKQLQKLATQADNLVPGSGRVAGTLKHSKFSELVNNSGMDNVFTEVSNKLGYIVPYGTKGSVRLDVVQYNSKGQIMGVWD